MDGIFRRGACAYRVGGRQDARAAQNLLVRALAELLLVRYHPASAKSVACAYQIRIWGRSVLGDSSMSRRRPVNSIVSTWLATYTTVARTSCYHEIRLVTVGWVINTTSAHLRLALPTPLPAPSRGAAPASSRREAAATDCAAAVERGAASGALLLRDTHGDLVRHRTLRGAQSVTRT